MKKCPFCGANIEDSARFCLYCMQSLTEKEQIPPHPKKKPQRWITAAAIAAVFLILAMIWFVRLIVPKNRTPSNDSSSPSTSQTTSSDASSHTHSYSVANASMEFLKEEATCITPAVFFYSCSCGEMGSSTFSHGEPGTHTMVTDPGYPADCVNLGLTDGAHCSVCNTILLAQTQMPVTNHTYDNKQDETCNVCNYVRVINCNHRETVSLSAIPATCIANGLTEGKKCTLCQEILTEQTILAPLGHTEVTDPAIESTCSTGGMTEGKHCSTCHTVLVAQNTVAAKGHTRIVDQAVAATCTVEGKTEGAHCSVCQVVFLYPQTISALGHSFDAENLLAPCSVCGTPSFHTHNYSVKNATNEYLKDAATCTRPSVYYYSCDCGEMSTETFSWGDAKGHTIETEPGYPATCDTPGLTDKRYCSVCQMTFTAHWEVKELGHTFEPGDSLSPCLVCGTMGTVLLSAPTFPVFQNNYEQKQFRFDGCTYVIRPGVEETWEFYISINCTNVSDVAAHAYPDVSLYYYEDGRGHGYSATCEATVRVQPNASVTSVLYVRIPNTARICELKFN